MVAVAEVQAVDAEAEDCAGTEEDQELHVEERGGQADDMSGVIGWWRAARLRNWEWSRHC